jgi:hypothetical protein
LQERPQLVMVEWSFYIFIRIPLLLRFEYMHVGRWFCEQGDSLVGQNKLQNVPSIFLLTVQEIKWIIVKWPKQFEHCE